MRTPSIEVPAFTLSGGNQQKLIVGREMTSDPKVLVASHPTRGVDVGAQAVIWDILRDARSAGLATLLVSADLEELIGLSDRLLVMLRGRVVAELDPAAVTPGRARLLHDGRRPERRREPAHPRRDPRPAPRRRGGHHRVVDRPADRRREPGHGVPGDVVGDRLDGVDRVDRQPGRAVLRRRRRRRHRVQDEPVQHRRRRPVPAGRAARRRRRRRRVALGAAARGVRVPRRRRRRGGVRGDRRDPQGLARRQRGDLDDHAQLHRHRDQRVPAVGAAAQRLQRQHRPDPHAAGSRPACPNLNALVEAVGFHLPPASCCAASCRSPSSSASATGCC